MWRSLWHLVSRRRTRPPHDFSEEILSHLDLEADELMRSGMPEREAREAARRRFGNVAAAQERFYESGRLLWPDRLARDAAYALRTLRHSPGYALAALATFGLGIGVTTTVFSLVYALGVRPLHVRDPERVVTVFQELGGSYDRRVNGSPEMLSHPEYLDFRDGVRAFEGLAAYAAADVALNGSDARARVQLVSCNYFGVMRARLAAGRGFAPDECAEGVPSPVAVVSHAFWRRALGGDPAAVGGAIRLGAHRATVIGVAEPGFRGTDIEAPDVWVPLPMHALLDPGAFDARDRDLSWLTLVGRLRPGAALATARAELAVIARRADAGYPGRETRVRADVGTLFNLPEMRRTGALVAGAVGAVAALVLLMACVNVMSLSLSRAIARRREIGVRLALGAGRGRLVRQLLTESILLALCGAVLGLVVAAWLPRLLVAAMPASGPPIDVVPDARVAAFAILVALLAAVTSGLAPALQATRLELTEALKGEGRGARRGEARLRGRLVGAQVASSLLLLVASGLLLRGVASARTMDPGYATRDVLSLTLDLQAADYTPERAAALYATLVERLSAAPGVRSVATAGSLPLLGRYSTVVSPVAAGAGAGAHGDAGVAGDLRDGLPASLAVVSGGYLSTMGIPIVRGRAFTDAEARAGGARPAVVSEALARRVWGAGDALGARLRDPEGEYVVVGVAADVQNVALGERDGPFFYIPAPLADPRGLKLVVRGQGDRPPDAAAVRALAAELAPAVPMIVESFTDRIERMLAPARTAAVASGIVGVLAGLLALVGVYGVASYNTSRRTRDIAIRIALGASARDVVALVIRDGARPVVLGLAVGALGAAAAAQLLRGVLFGVSPLDPGAFAGAVALLGSAAFMAMYRPARRAAAVEPAMVLRGD